MSTIHKIPEYLYEDCTVQRWVDGDTLVMRAAVQFDPGFHIDLTVGYTGMFRLLFVDAWEKREPLGPAATAFVNMLMPVGSAVCARTYKDPDNFGRYLADLWTPEAPDFTVSAQLIEAGLGVPYRK
jgi:endonuclease YncB( thermonuclease family)